MGEVDGVLGDVHLLVQRRVHQHGSVGDQQRADPAGDMHDEDMADPAAGAETGVAANHFGQQDVGMQVALHRASA